jgi:hypothetical protein
MGEQPNPAGELRAHLATFNSLPVLFVGSGLSRRYLSAPDWQGLLEHFARALGREVSYYKGKTDAGLPGLATEIARDLYQAWWDRPEYQESRLAFGNEISEFSDPLKIEITRFLDGLEVTTDSALLKEIEGLKTAKVHAIITTNWDRLLEQTFPDLEVFTGQQEILFSDTQAVGEIYKIHGSIHKPSSLVLTAEDYNKYEAANPYLLAKLLTLFVENPVIFVGYSMTDTHIQSLLSSLLDCMSVENVQKLNDRLIFLRWVREPSKERYRYAPLLLEGRNIQVVECAVASFLDVFRVLADLPRRFPVKLLRQLKREVYELALKERPAGRIFVADINDDTQLDQVDVVIGVGTIARLGKKGYQVFSRKDLVLAMLDDDKSLDASELFQHVISSIFANAKFAPIHYPLSLARRAGIKESVVDTMPQRARELAEGRIALEPYFSADGVAGRPFSEVVAKDPLRALHAGLACTFDEAEDIEALLEFLRDRFDRSVPPSTEHYKLACLYDRLVFADK